MFYASTDNECQYITQETGCLGPAPYKCKCSPGKYFDRDEKKCKTLIGINDTCLQGDSCKTGHCIGTPLTCQCLPSIQYFDENSGRCLNQFSNSTSIIY